MRNRALRGEQLTWAWRLGRTRHECRAQLDVPLLRTEAQLRKGAERGVQV